MDIKTKRKMLVFLKKILENGYNGTQEELVMKLHKQNFKITQATMSRALKQLGVIKSHGPNGSIYKLDKEKQSYSLQHQPFELIESIEANEAIIVIKTAPGSAMLIASYLDKNCKDHLIGTVAGDDTIFAAPNSTTAMDHHREAIEKKVGFS